ncbi:hypothetical protein [Arachidicoccus terrestris]|uniref:hypothetical protein n=1 Tax=Arachidicoccus terrestris TaxID=2875539 RepID=UPI001CC6DAF2|nr:hypothetical protein [Arachidicoccus terrestris]UAY55417.1 hypothetical protein K9M52_18755 [Arachidicoccus terrestris]
MERKFFKQRQDGFVTHAINSFILIMGAVLLVWSISVFARGYIFDFQSFNVAIRSLAPAWVILSLYWLAIGVVRIKIVPASHEMTKQYLFGLYSKRYSLSDPLDVFVATHYQRGKRVESDVLVKTSQGNVKVRTFPKSTQIDPFIREFKSLFGTISPL